MNRKTSILTATVLVLMAIARCFSATPTEWEDTFKSLSAGISRTQAEQKIEMARKIKSNYDIYAMDTESLVAYKLDDKTILLVTYRPGMPAAHVIGGDGHPPQDGELTGFRVLVVR